MNSTSSTLGLKYLPSVVHISFPIKSTSGLSLNNGWFLKRLQFGFVEGVVVVV
jgi:hypothetical protein